MAPNPEIDPVAGTDDLQPDDAAALDQVINAAARAVTAVSGDDPDRAAYMVNLGVALLRRSERTGAQADLDKAIEMTREAVAATPADQPDRAGRLYNLGVALQMRFGRTGALADLDEAIAVAREAVAATPPTTPTERPT